MTTQTIIGFRKHLVCKIEEGCCLILLYGADGMNLRKRKRRYTFFITMGGYIFLLTLHLFIYVLLYRLYSRFLLLSFYCRSKSFFSCSKKKKIHVSIFFIVKKSFRSILLFVGQEKKEIKYVLHEKYNLLLYFKILLIFFIINIILYTRGKFI